MKQRISERRERAAGDVGRAVYEEGHPPAVRVFVALDAQRVLGREQGAMDLARDHATKTEEATHTTANGKFVTLLALRLSRTPEPPARGHRAFGAARAPLRGVRRVFHARCSRVSGG